MAIKSESIFTKLSSALIGQFGLLVAGVLITVVTARSLGTTGKGIFTLALTVATTLAAISQGAIPAAVSYFAGREPQHRPPLLGNILFLALVWGGISSLIAAWLLKDIRLQYFSELDTVIWEIVLITIPPLLLFEFSNRLMLGMGAIRKFSATLVGKELLLLISLLVLMMLGRPTAYSAVALWALSLIVISALMYHHSLKEASVSPVVNMPFLGRMLKFSVRAWGAGLFATLKLRFDPILLAIYMTPADIGYYSIATAMVAALSFLPTAISQVVLPIVSGQGDDVGNRITPLLTRLGLFFVFIAAIIIGTLGSWGIELLVGRQFLPAYPALILLLPGTVILSLAKILSGDLLGRGQPQYGAITSAISFFAHVAVAVFLIPRYGIAGAAATTSITNAFTGLMFLHFFLRESGLPVREVLLPKMADFQLLMGRFLTNRNGWR